MSEVVFQPTDIVLAKVKGFSAWPAMIIPNELIPDNILKNKPVGVHKGKSANGKEAEVEERERSNDDDDNDDDDDDEEEVFDDSETSPEKFIIYTPVLKFRKNDTVKPVYCVKFFFDDSYIWVKPMDMKILTSEECRQWLNSKQRKNKKLIPAYEMAMKGKDGVDIWEFVEYGSYGKPDEEEYVEEDEEEERKKPIKKPTRSSSRQRQKRVLGTESSEKVEVNKKRRMTRSSKQQTVDESEEDEDEDGEEEEEEEEVEGVEEFVRKRPQRGKSKKAVAAKPKPKSKPKPKPKSKPKKEKPKPPKVIKYHFEDDEDWSIVGLGPQDLSIEKTMDPIAKKLSQKKNLEKHTEIKLDLEDKLTGINKLLCGVLCSGIDRAVSIKDDFEIILDELQIALNTRGSKNEFITIFQSNNSLLFYFRILFNLRKRELDKWDLWDRFQDIFEHIYSYEFKPDTTDWQVERNMEVKEEQEENKSPYKSVEVEEPKVGA